MHAYGRSSPLRRWKELNINSYVRFGQEAEDVVRVPIGNLRALLRLWDIDNKTNYHELLAVADYLERLGLDVYFREEVTAILQRVFRLVFLAYLFGRGYGHERPGSDKLHAPTPIRIQ